MCLSAVFPTLPLPKGDPSVACKDPRVLQNLMDDPLFYSGRLTVRTCYSVLRLIQHFRSMESTLETGYICIQGLADQLVCPKAVQGWHAKCPVKDKTIHVYPELRHSVLFEPEYEDAQLKVLDWVRSRVIK